MDNMLIPGVLYTMGVVIMVDRGHGKRGNKWGGGGGEVIAKILMRIFYKPISDGGEFFCCIRGRLVNRVTYTMIS